MIFSYFTMKVRVRLLEMRLDLLAFICKLSDRFDRQCAKCEEKRK